MKKLLYLLLFIPLLSNAQYGGRDEYLIETDSLSIQDAHELSPVTVKYLIIDENGGVGYVTEISSLADYLPLAGGTMTGAIISDSGAKLNEYNGRQSSWEFSSVGSEQYGTTRLDLWTSTNTDTYDPNDGFVQTFFWDTPGRFDAQLYIPNKSANSPIKYRAKGDDPTFPDWVNVWDSDHAGSTSYNWSSNVNNSLQYNLNGTNINTGGTLSNVAYLDQSNTFTQEQLITQSSYRPLRIMRTGTGTNVNIEYTHIGGTRYLGMDANLDLSWGGNANADYNPKIWHAGNSNLTSVSWSSSRFNVDDSSTYIDKDGSNNMTFTDAVTGTKTLASLLDNATHTGEVTGATALTVADNVIDYANVDETLKQEITDNDGAFDMNAAGIINCSISTNTTFSFSNIYSTRSIAIELVVSSSATVSWNTTPKSIVGDEISGNGTYLIHVFSWGTTEGDLEVTVTAL